MLAEPHTLLWDYGLSAQLVRTHSTTLKMTPGSVSVPPVSIRVQGLCKECQTQDLANTPSEAVMLQKKPVPKGMGLPLLPGSQIPQGFHKHAAEMLLLLQPCRNSCMRLVVLPGPAPSWSELLSLQPFLLTATSTATAHLLLLP